MDFILTNVMCLFCQPSVLAANETKIKLKKHKISNLFARNKISRVLRKHIVMLQDHKGNQNTGIHNILLHTLVISLIPLIISMEKNQDLCSPIAREARKTVFSLPLSKAPGPVASR